MPPFVRALPLILGACSIASPFEGPGYDGSGTLISSSPGPFLAVVTEATVRAGGGSGFQAYVDTLSSQLEAQDGLIGTSLRGQLLGSNRWTLTVWEDEAAMIGFVASDVHLEAMVDAATLTESIRSASWQVQADQVPPDWGDALEQLDASDLEPSPGDIR